MKITQKTVTGSGLVVKRKRRMIEIIDDYHGCPGDKVDASDLAEIIKPDIEKWFNGGETMDFKDGKRTK